MKKLKAFLFTLIAGVLTLSVAGCASDTTPPVEEDDITLVMINVNTENAKTEYFVGEAFTTEGLVVTSVLRNNTKNTVQYDAPVDIKDVVVDSSDFDSSAPGECTISLSYTYREITRTAEYDVTVEKAERVSRLVLDTTDVQTVYDMDEDISTDGLKATAIDYDYKNNVALAPYEVNVSDLKLDTSAFKKGEVGTYNVVASYTKDDETVTASYEVFVKKAAGLVLETENTDYDLTAEGVVINLNEIDVFAAGANGKRGEALTEGYTFSAYLGDEAVTIADNKITATESGAYNIWAKYEGYEIPGTSEVADIDGFIIIYVNDTLQAIEFNSSAAGTVTTQAVGADTMTATWTFTAKYSSGATKLLTNNDVKIANVVTSSVNSAGVANITYTELDAKGVEKTVTTTVNYTITEAAQVTSGVAGIGFENMTVVTKQAAPYDEATNGTLSIANTDSILISSAFIHTTSDNFSIKEVAATITTENGELNLTKALVTEGGSRSTTRRSVQFVLPEEGTYTINVWASVVSETNTGRFVKASNGVSSSYVDFSKAGTQVGNELTVDVQKCTLANVNGGTWYIGGSASIVIHYIEIVKVS